MASPCSRRPCRGASGCLLGLLLPLLPRLSSAISAQHRVRALAPPAPVVTGCNGPGGLDVSLAEFASVGRDVVTFARDRAEVVRPGGNPTIALTFADYNYRATLVNWLVGVSRSGVNNFAVVCLDKQLAELLTSVGGSCVLANLPASWTVGSLWTLRIAVAASLLDAGLDVVLSDTDAVWLRNPLPLLGGADIMSSRGTMPVEVTSMLGCAACMGFISFRATPAVVDFLRNDVGTRLPQCHFDDQLAMNLALVDNHVHFPQRLWVVGHHIDTGTMGNLSVAMLDHARFPRYCKDSKTHMDQAYVAHCLDRGRFAEKNASRREHAAQNHGVWFLREDWEVVPKDGGLTAWLSRVRAS